jgi:succinyl-CoA synthetase beta subunit
MATGVGEVLIGFRRDPDVGPIVILAPGGIFAELAGERSLRLAPVTLDDARAMIAELPSMRALTGYRGRPAGDLAALAAAIVALSRFADDADVIEAEINPLIVRGQGDGVVAVDALMRVVEEAKP